MAKYKMTYRYKNYYERICVFVFLFVVYVVNTFSYAQSLDVNNSDTILIASEPDYPPYCIVDENGNADGFSIDLFKAAADAAGLSVEIKVGVWNKIKHDLADGIIDALPLVGRTPEREELYEFTMPYLSLHGGVFVREGTAPVRSLSDLYGKEVVVMKGDNAEEFVRRENISDKIFTTNTYEEAFQLLASGEYDALITQRITGIKLLERLDIKSVEPLDLQIPGFRQDFCFAVQKGDKKLQARLNEGLSIIIANNTFEDIRTKWFGPAFMEKVSPGDIIRIALVIFIPLVIVVALFFILFLRREVRRRTARLNTEIKQHKKTLDEYKAQKSMLEESETRLSLLLNSTEEGIYGVDLNGNCTLINYSALQLLGFNNTREVIGKNMHNLIHYAKPDGSPCELSECKIYKSFVEGEATQSNSEVLWRTDGTSFPAEYFSHPIKLNNQVIGSVVTFWDITERKKAEEELLQLKSNLEDKVIQRTAELEDKMQKLRKSQTAMLYMVEDLNEITARLKEETRKLELSRNELEAFSYSVSHDLRSPLRAIDGFSGFLIEDYYDKLDDEGKRLIQVIRKSAQKMDKLILDLLNLSRLSRAEMKMSMVDMETVAKQVFEEVSTPEEKNKFNLVFENMCPAVCDPNLIAHVWNNLIGNAIKYSAKTNTKKIIISCMEEDKKLIYSVEDFGAGFNQKYADKLFKVFQRLHRDNEFPGTGVGLSIVQRIVLRHEGEVWAEGEEGKGATFYFSLPAIGV
ncbi:MAG: transporter substrate-binding domain-containing protein [Prolixibacteraceae bacterium]|nr:transporter substrate-binding domain-containing protein [Prolixibacteraceae bacterium]